MPLNLDIENIDTSYDHLLEDLTWLPWIGKNFNNTSKKTLILGESLYKWKSKNEEDLINSIHSKIFLRTLHQRLALNIKKSSRYVRNIERAIFLSKSTNQNEIDKLWLSVAYHNLVLRTMKNRQERPDYSDYEDGWKKVFNLFEALKITQCIVYGLENNKVKSLLNVAKAQNIKLEHNKRPKIGKTTPRVISITINTRPTTLLLIRHPSAFFSWRNWGKFLQNENFHI